MGKLNLISQKDRVYFVCIDVLFGLCLIQIHVIVGSVYPRNSPEATHTCLFRKVSYHRSSRGGFALQLDMAKGIALELVYSVVPHAERRL